MRSKLDEFVDVGGIVPDVAVLKCDTLLRKPRFLVLARRSPGLCVHHDLHAFTPSLPRTRPESTKCSACSPPVFFPGFPYVRFTGGGSMQGQRQTGESDGRPARTEGAPHAAPRGPHTVAAPGLHVLFVGANPGRNSAQTGHHFAGPGNHFWRLLVESGLTPLRLTPEQDRLLPTWGIGITNIADRASPGERDLTAAEWRLGGARVRSLVSTLRPQAVALLGKAVACAYLDRPAHRAPEFGRVCGYEHPTVWVLPNPSARSTVPYATRLAYFRDLVRALAADIPPWPAVLPSATTVDPSTLPRA